MGEESLLFPSLYLPGTGNFIAGEELGLHLLLVLCHPKQVYLNPERHPADVCLSFETWKREKQGVVKRLGTRRKSVAMQTARNSEYPPFSFISGLYAKRTGDSHKKINK